MAVFADLHDHESHRYSYCKGRQHRCHGRRHNTCWVGPGTVSLLHLSCSMKHCGAACRPHTVSRCSQSLCLQHRTLRLAAKVPRSWTCSQRGSHRCLAVQRAWQGAGSMAKQTEAGVPEPGLLQVWDGCAMCARPFRPMQGRTAAQSRSGMPDHVCTSGRCMPVTSAASTLAASSSSSPATSAASAASSATMAASDSAAATPPAWKRHSVKGVRHSIRPGSSSHQHEAPGCLSGRH